MNVDAIIKSMSLEEIESLAVTLQAICEAATSEQDRWLRFNYGISLVEARQLPKANKDKLQASWQAWQQKKDK